MATKRKQILDQVETLLKNIKISNGFNIDLLDNNISHRVLDIDNLHSEDTPHISLSIGSGSPNTFITTGSNIDSTLVIILDIYIYTQPEIDPVEELDNFLQDIERAILNGTPNSPWNDKYKTASLDGLPFVYSVSFEEQMNTDEGLLSLHQKAFARWPLTIKYLRSTINP
jgi:hypothetical protein